MNANPNTIRYGMQITLRHDSTNQLLKSLNRPYCHPKTSAQQMVVATRESDESTLWRILGSSVTGQSLPAGEEVKHGDVIRLGHVLTGKHLHSHGDRKAPITTDQQEVTAWHGGAATDAFDDWIVETHAKDVWFMDQPIRLVHKGTNKNLHSNDRSDPVYTAGFQEVTAFEGRDENDLWTCRTSDQLPLEKRFNLKQFERSRWLTWLSIVGSIASITGWTLLSLRETMSTLTFVRFLSVAFASTLILGFLLILTAGLQTIYLRKTFKPRARFWSTGFWLIAGTIYALGFLASWRLLVLASEYIFSPFIRWATGITS